MNPAFPSMFGCRAMRTSHRQRVHAMAATGALVVGLFLSAGLPPVQAAENVTSVSASVPTSPPDDVTLLLEGVAAANHGLTSLETTFTQRKYLSFLDEPLDSSGVLCFSRPKNAQTDTPSSIPKGRIFWEYRSPELSGFVYENGQGSLWVRDRSTIRPMQETEAAVFKTMAAHIMAWLEVRPDALRKLYAMTRLQDDGAPGLRLVPRRRTGFFQTLEVRFTPDLRQVESLIFQEQNGDSTRLLFDKARINETRTPDCAP